MRLDKIFNELGITEYGVVSADNADDLILKSTSALSPKIKAKCIYDILPDAKSIIVYLLPYNNGIKPNNLSMYATGTDYHYVCSEINHKICNALKNAGESFVSFADNGPLDERRLANRAGLGLIGTNGFLINKTYGSYTFISYVITSQRLDATKSTQSVCLRCNKCINSCPGGALSWEKFDENKCVSYLTQKKGDLNDEQINLLRRVGSAWGCDICQNVCPMNNKVQLSNFPYFNKDLILCINYEYLSNRMFQKKYNQRAFSWRGKSVIDRNLSIINENSNDV